MRSTTVRRRSCCWPLELMTRSTNAAERTDAVDRASITAFRGSMSTQPDRQLIFGIRRQDTPMATARNTLGEYLLDEDPLHPLWLDLVSIVFRDNPSDAHVERLGPSATVLYDVGMFAGEVIN